MDASERAVRKLSGESVPEHTDERRREDFPLALAGLFIEHQQPSTSRAHGHGFAGFPKGLGLESRDAGRVESSLPGVEAESLVVDSMT